MQQDVLDSEAEMLCFAGSAGSLKTETLIMDAVQEFENPNLRALIFRESHPQLLDIVDKTMKLYRDGISPYKGKYNEQKKTWTFPSGATIRLGFMARDNDVYDYWGHAYSFIGPDESTRQSEFRLRTIISRLRSTDPTLRQRVRMPTNPGGDSSNAHKHIFLRGHCPVHEPAQSAVPGKIYHDARWMSDGAKIPMNVSFIPGRLSDHNLLGPAYVDKLHMQEGALAAQLELGCWCSLEGSYFPFLTKDFICPNGAVGDKWWHTHFGSIDYGYGKSNAAGGLYHRGDVSPAYPSGQIRKLGEIRVAGMQATDFAHLYVKTFVTPMVNGNRRNISVVFLDPSNFKHIGDGQCIADQIQVVLEPYGITVMEASNDRIGGAQVLYRMLNTREFEICDTCRKTFAAIQTRRHDDKKPGDVKKIIGDPDDDSYDETRYAINSFMQSSSKPTAEKVEEAVKDLRKQGDITSFMVRYRQAIEEAEEVEEPIALNPRRQQMNNRRGRR